MSYFADLKQAVDRIPQEAIDDLLNVLDYSAGGRQIFVIGNGGSAATASHFACDLIKNVPGGLRAVALDNLATLTAFANDDGYDVALVSQLITMADGKDILIAISTSGNSPNVVMAAQWFKNVGFVVALTGFDGGELGRLAHLHIHVPSDCIEIVEDCHLAICHSIIWRLKDDA